MPLRISYPTQLITTVGQQVRIALPSLNSRTLTQHTVTMAANAAIGAESLTVAPLPSKLYAGERLRFGSSNILAILSDTIESGVTTIPVLPLDVAIASGLTARTYATLFVAGATDASPSSQPKTVDATSYNSEAGSEMATVGTSRTLSFTFNRIEGDVGGDALMQVLYNDAFFNREIFAFVERSNGEIYSGAAVATTGAQQGPTQEKVTMNVNLQFQGESFRFQSSANAQNVFEPGVADEDPEIPANALTHTDGQLLTGTSGDTLTVSSLELVFTEYTNDSAAFSAAIKFDQLTTLYAPHTVAGAINFTVNAVGAVAGYGAIVRLTANGVHSPSFTGLNRTSTSKGYVNILGRLNVIKFFFDGTNYWYEIIHEVTAI